MLEGSGARLVHGIFWRNMGKLHSMVHLHSCVGLARFAGLNVRSYSSMISRDVKFIHRSSVM